MTDPFGLVAKLIDIGNVDTVYRDDLLGIGREYDSDRLMARFAVVRLERMVAWS